MLLSPPLNGGSMKKAPQPFSAQGFGGSRRRWAAAQMSGQDFELVGRHLAALAVGNELEGNLVSLAQLADACPFDGADMDEGVWAAAIERDEAKAFFGIKPLYGSLSHGNPFLDTLEMLASVDAVGRYRTLSR
jgi:hypothetical protein